VLRGWGGGLLRRDAAVASVASKRKRKKEAYLPADTSLQVLTHRSNYSCEEIPAGKYLQVLAPQTHGGTTSAASSTWYVLAGISVGLYLQSLPVERRLI